MIVLWWADSTSVQRERLRRDPAGPGQACRRRHQARRDPPARERTRSRPRSTAGAPATRLRAPRPRALADDRAVRRGRRPLAGRDPGAEPQGTRGGRPTPARSTTPPRGSAWPRRRRSCGSTATIQERRSPRSRSAGRSANSSTSSRRRARGIEVVDPRLLGMLKLTPAEWRDKSLFHLPSFRVGDACGHRARSRPEGRARRRALAARPAVPRGGRGRQGRGDGRRAHIAPGRPRDEGVRRQRRHRQGRRENTASTTRR